MSTRTLASRIAKLVPSGWSIDGNLSILKLIQEAQDELLDFEGRETIFVDPATGVAPYLQTQGGVRLYTVDEDNLSCSIVVNGRDVRAKKVLGVYYLGTGSAYPQHQLYADYLGSGTVLRVPVAGMECTDVSDAQVRFRDDPGTYENRFQVLFTWEAPRLLSVNIPLMVPAEFESAIEDYVLGKITSYAHGRSNDRTVKFERYWKPRYKDRSSANSDVQENYTVPRFC